MCVQEITQPLGKDILPIYKKKKKKKKLKFGGGY